MLGVFKSLLLLSIISSLGATISYYCGYDFMYSFLAITLIQIVISAAVNTVVSSYTALKNKELENDRLRLYAVQSAELKCAFCGEVSVVPIRMDVDNEYECPSCTKRNSVYLNITVARSTTPMSVSPLSTSIINDEEDAILEQIKES